MTLRQSQFVPPVPLVAARRMGLLDDIDLDAQRTAGSPRQLAGLLSGEIDLAVTAIDNLFAWVPAGADVRLVAQMESTTPLGIYARPGTAALEALEGRRFAVDAATNGFALVARYALEARGIEVEYVEVGGVKERLDALLAGEVAATLLGPPFDSAAEQAGAPLLATMSSVLPAFPGQGLVVRTDLLASDELQTYLGALTRATAAAAEMSDPEGEALLVEAGFGEAAGSAWTARPRTLVVDPAGLGLLTDIRTRLGMMPPGIRLQDLHDPRLLTALG